MCSIYRPGRQHGVRRTWTWCNRYSCTPLPQGSRKIKELRLLPTDIRLDFNWIFDILTFLVNGRNDTTDWGEGVEWPTPLRARTPGTSTRLGRAENTDEKKFDLPELGPTRMWDEHCATGAGRRRKTNSGRTSVGLSRYPARGVHGRAAPNWPRLGAATVPTNVSTRSASENYPSRRATRTGSTGDHTASASVLPPTTTSIVAAVVAGRAARTTRYRNTSHDVAADVQGRLFVGGEKTL